MSTTALLTDHYELTMLASALQDGTAQKPAVFELFARKLPSGRRYGVVGGTNRAIRAIEDFTFTQQQIHFLQQSTDLNKETLQYLRDYTFQGTVTGYPEGELYYPGSPILTVEGTFGECVILETMLLSIFNHDAAVMSAASRMVNAATTYDAGQSKTLPIIEMGSRRTHEQAAPAAARAAYIAGFHATSNLEAGFQYGVPTTGTSAHAFTLAHETETAAFQQQVNTLGNTTTLLVDTYDITQGIENAIATAGTQLGGVRIDSGDLYDETLKARQQLDAAGNTDTNIILSSDIDEYVIAELLERKTPVDGIGAGTRVVMGSGHPTAGMVYKLVAIDHGDGYVPVSKTASGKLSIGGKKAGYRDDENGIEYVVADGCEAPAHARKLAHTFIQDGDVLLHTDHNETAAGGSVLADIEAPRAYHRNVVQNLTAKQRNIQAGEPACETRYITGKER